STHARQPRDHHSFPTRRSSDLRRREKSPSSSGAVRARLCRASAPLAEECAKPVRLLSVVAGIGDPGWTCATPLRDVSLPQRTALCSRSSCGLSIASLARTCRPFKKSGGFQPLLE